MVLRRKKVIRKNRKDVNVWPEKNKKEKIIWRRKIFGQRRRKMK